MNEKNILELINKTFDVKLVETDYDKKISDTIQWESFLIMTLLTEMMERYNKRIDLEALFSANTIGELVTLLVGSKGK